VTKEIRLTDDHVYVTNRRELPQDWTSIFLPHSRYGNLW